MTRLTEHGYSVYNDKNTEEGSKASQLKFELDK